MSFFDCVARNSPVQPLTIWNPQSIYIWYILCIASQTSLTLRLMRWVTVVKQIFLLYVIKKICPLTKKISIPMQTFCWSCNSSQGTFTKLWGLRWPVSRTVPPLSLGTEAPQILWATLASSTVTVQPPMLPTQSTALKSAFIWWIGKSLVKMTCFQCTLNLLLGEQLHIVSNS